MDDLTLWRPVFGPPPPGEPVPIDWTAVQEWLGLTLPGDYKAVAQAYGPLDVGGFIWLHVPCVQDERFDYGTWLTETRRRTRAALRDVAPDDPRAIHPTPGGLLAWRITRASDVLFWDTAAAAGPDRWPVVVFRPDAAYRGEEPWFRCGTPMAETLVAAARTGLWLSGPLPARASRTAFLRESRPWTPPPRVAPDPRREAALTEGTGLAGDVAGAGWLPAVRRLDRRRPVRLAHP